MATDAFSAEELNLLYHYTYHSSGRRHSLTQGEKKEPDNVRLLWRCLADSNRRAWFCRPVTQPLIQGTMFY